MSRPAARPLRQAAIMLALAAASTALTFWLAGGFQAAAPAITTPSVPVERSTPKANPPPAFAIASGPQGTLAFVQSLRHASAAELRAAFLSTRDYAARCAITARWAALDPSGCFATVNAAIKAAPADIGLFWGVMPLVFEQWAHVDHAAARDALAGMDVAKDSTLAAFVETCALQGGAAWAALLDDPRFAMANPPIAGRPRLDSGPISPGEAMRSLNAAIRCGRYGMYWLSALRYGAKGGEVQDSISAWKELPPVLRSGFTAEIVRGLLDQNPEQATIFMAGLPVDEREKASAGYAAALAKKDAAASWSWLSQNAQGQRTTAASSWGTTVAPEDGVRVLDGALPSRARDAAGAALAKQWLRAAPAEAAAWMTGLTDPNMKRRVWQEAVATWVQQAPEQAVAAFTAPGAPPLRQKDAQVIARSLAAGNPALLLAFAAGLSPNLQAAVQEFLPKPDKSAR